MTSKFKGTNHAAPILNIDKYGNCSGSQNAGLNIQTELMLDMY